MKRIAFRTTWGTITLKLNENGQASALDLPLLQKVPREPFAVTGPGEAAGMSAAEFFHWLEKTFPESEEPQGTAFRQTVWSALKKIPRGQTRTYSELAAAIGRPQAARAVGSACGANPLPVFIPCHRVVAKNGPGGFGSGLPWKKLLLKNEIAERGWKGRVRQHLRQSRCCRIVRAAR
jgi:methylated-DNA-[protein]-cysteine S-methyltransferase